MADLYLLDTNIFTYAINGKSRAVRRKLEQVQQEATIAISAVTEGEILFGLELNPGALRLRSAVQLLLSTVEVLSWDSSVASFYGKLRASLTTKGKSMSAMDMLIAAHAYAAGAVLVTHDLAYVNALPWVVLEDWATDLQQK